MFERLKFSLIASLIPIIILSISLIVNFLVVKKNTLDKKNFNVSQIIDWKEYFVFFCFNFFLHFLVYPILPKLKGDDAFSSIISISVILLFFSYGIIIYPLLLLFRNTKYEPNKPIEEYVYSIAKEKIHVRVINSSLINAYATGILPFSKMILLGKPLVDKLSQVELKCIILHEIGHIKKKHILTLTFILIGLQIFGFLIYNDLLIPWVEKFRYVKFRWLIKGTCFGVFNLVVLEIVSIYQKKMEHSADIFAATIIGRVEFSDALKKLDHLTNGMLSRKTLTHPTLQQRLNKIKES